MVACRHSFALRERRQPKMLPEVLDNGSLLSVMARSGRRLRKSSTIACAVVDSEGPDGSDGTEGANETSVSSRRPPAPHERAPEREATLAERVERVLL